MIKILLIDNNDSFTYNLAQIFKQHKRVSLKIMKHNIAMIDQLKEFDKIVLSPGPGLPNEFPILEAILSRFEKEKSILGVCLGHQAIAEHYGGTIVNLPFVVHGIQKPSMVVKNDVLFENLPAKFDVGLYHSWHVLKEDFPNELEILMESEDGLIMSLAHKKNNVKGVQFHPESIMTKFGVQLLNNWIEN